ncbi:MAG: PEGA domain-containing protein [Myxococcales bacterium]|nr:MAG: PEGA domain-containing protein [Myxococcales bacterium]
MKRGGGVRGPLVVAGAPVVVARSEPRPGRPAAATPLHLSALMMVMPRASLPAACVMVSFLTHMLWTPTAGAQGKPRPAPAAPAKPEAARADVARADRLRQLRVRGEQAMLELRYREALEAFGEAYRESGEPTLLYNMARSYQGLERFPEALDHLERFRELASAATREQVPQLDELIAQTRQRVSWLVIDADRPGARVMLRGVELGRTPLPGPVRVVAGEGRLEVLLDGYFAFERPLTLPGGERHEVRVSLLARDRTGILGLRSQPTGALFTVDGKELGMSPVEAPLDVGTHRLRLTKPGFVALDTQLQVEAGERREVTFTLERQAPLTSRWWFWAGIGAVVAGGVVLTYALTTERDPPRGTVEPGVVRSSLVRF